MTTISPRRIANGQLHRLFRFFVLPLEDFAFFFRPRAGNLTWVLSLRNDDRENPRGPGWHLGQKKLLLPATIALRIDVPHR
jgi:hypothetical protein